MKKNTFLFILFLLGVSWATLCAAPHEVNLYGHLVSSNESETPQGIYQFSNGSAAGFTRVAEITAEPNAGAVKAGDLYYVFNISDQGDYGNECYMYIYDPANNYTLVTRASASSSIMSEAQVLAYDPVTKKIYCAYNDAYYGNRLATIDVSHRTRDLVASLDYTKFITLSFNSQGRLFGITNVGILYEINKSTGETRYIGSTGVSPAEYQQSATFVDGNDSTLYWAACSAAQGALYAVDVTSAKTKLVKVISLLRDFAMEYKDMPTLGFTHFQPAQLTTVGKRASLWLWELIMDLENVNFQLSRAALLGSKGTTGTQASFMELFDGDVEKVKALDKKICEKMGYKKFYPVSGQTYSRKLDYQMLSVLSGIAQSAYKFANDIRLLQNLKEIEEPFEKNQIGSSAMAYKRNPMRSERICSLARYVMVDALNPAMTTATQWFERTLDDSANKRISVAEAFLAVDAILNIYMNVASGLVVYPKVIHSRVMSELPFMATENILMDAVKKGGDRQELHEKIRVHSMAAARVVKEEGGKNDLIERIVADPAFGLTMEDVQKILKPENFTGRAANQVEELVADYVDPALKENNVVADEVELTV